MKMTIIIDKIQKECFQGWMIKDLNKDHLFLHALSQEFKIDLEIYERNDVENAIGFIGKIPKQIIITASDLIDKKIYFTYDRIKIIPIWNVALTIFYINQTNNLNLFNYIKNNINYINDIEKNKEYRIYNDIIIGKYGFLFLENGSNFLYKKYFMQNNEVDIISNKIINIIQKRKIFFKNNNIRFLQILIPEKSSCLNELTLLNIPKMTPLYKKITNIMKNDENFIDVYYIVNNKNCWNKYDTHFSSLGAQNTIREILNYLNYNKIKIEYTGNDIFYHHSDLLDHLLGKNVYESIQIYSSIRNTNNPILFEKYDPIKSNTNTMRYYKNDKALINKRILVFGNSFFERGNYSMQLSWHFARIFNEFIFIWKDTIDKSIINKYKPDICICQTIERFLPYMPKRFDNIADAL